MSEQRHQDREIAREHYRLRSWFFYREHTRWAELIPVVDALCSTDQDWSSHADLAITDPAWRHIQEKAIPPPAVFCHPEIIRENPRLIAYYRLLAGLPQKGFSRIAFNVKPLEDAATATLESERAIEIARILNRMISALIEADPTFELPGARMAATMTLGTQINGSWRNRLGAEGTRHVRELLLRYFGSEGLVEHLRLRDALAQFDDMLSADDLDSVQEITLRNGYRVVFGSDPDVSIFDPAGDLQAAIEVKAGTDAASALERYGAAKKSFDAALKRNKAADTIYLSSCITDGVRAAMAEDRLVKHEFSLTDVLTDEEERNRFLSHVRWLVHLS